MATVSARAISASPQNSVLERWYIAALALALIGVSIAGFVPSLAHPTGRRAPLSLLAAVHGAVFFSWQVLFLIQSCLVAARRVSVHRRLGAAAGVLTAVAIPLGWVTMISMARRGFDLSGDLKVIRHASPGFIDPIDGMLFPLTDLLMFAVLAGAALLYRRRPEIHKRLMLFANIMLAPSGLGHLLGHFPRLSSLPGAIIMVPIGMFLGAAIARDYLSARKVHPLSWTLAVLIFVSGPVRAFLVLPSEVWRHFAAWLIG